MSGPATMQSSTFLVPGLFPGRGMRFQPCQIAVSPKSGLLSWLTITLVLHLSQHRSTYQSHGPTSRVDDSWCKQPWPIPIRARMALLVSDRVGRILNTNLMYQSYVKMWIDCKRKGKLNYELITQAKVKQRILALSDKSVGEVMWGPSQLTPPHNPKGCVATNPLT